MAPLVAMEVFTDVLVGEKALTDPFVADLNLVVLLERTRDLRAPVLVDQRFDQDLGGGDYAVPGFITSVQGQLMSMLGAIIYQPTIAAQFPLIVDL
jgi:hypothetical protein